MQILSVLGEVLSTQNGGSDPNRISSAPLVNRSTKNIKRHTLHALATQISHPNES